MIYILFTFSLLFSLILFVSIMNRLRKAESIVYKMVDSIHLHNETFMSTHDRIDTIQNRVIVSEKNLNQTIRLFTDYIEAQNARNKGVALSSEPVKKGKLN